MIVSNSGKMRRLKEKIRESLAKNMVLNLIEAVISSRVITYEDLLDIIKDAPDVMSSGVLEDNIKIYDVLKEELLKTPYLSNINIEEETIGNMQYSNHRAIKRNSLAIYSEDYRNSDTFEIQKEFFRPDKNLRLPMLNEINKNIAYMSIEPHEMRTLDSFVNNAYGDVLVCGCGLGYTAYMLSEKENVNSITILEINKDVISLFEKQILPQIPNVEKINIVECDANEFLNNTDLSIYDYINVDLWYDTFDMVYLYIKCSLLESKYPNTHFTYWLEQTFFIQIQEELLTYIYSGSFSEMIPQISKVAKGIVSVSEDLINDEESLNRFLSKENIKGLIIKWASSNMDIVEEIGQSVEKDQKEYTSGISSILKSKTFTNKDFKFIL